jgi:hypothetical protein
MVLVIRSSVLQPQAAALCRLAGWCSLPQVGDPSWLSTQPYAICVRQGSGAIIFLLVAALSSLSQCASLPGCWLGQLIGHVQRST